ncbi:hypothetical protein LSH36_1149g00015 [Paralvinella palmiformis]|uniref:Uncharacterized protein n=1 Tax=Paralvinella palmiformis TaxID=53620 RepID=A0AAD9IUY2_9ANNE|nr:hypothetical protein LSH36_1149g00015 [Paralvinella palmiformis]
MMKMLLLRFPMFFHISERTNVDVIILVTSVLIGAFGVNVDPNIMIDTLKDARSHLKSWTYYIQYGDHNVPDAKVHLYVGNTSLRSEDLKTLKPKHWLNDQVCDENKVEFLLTLVFQKICHS